MNKEPVMNWRSHFFLAVVGLIIVLLVGAGVCFGLVYRRSTLQGRAAIAPTSFPTATSEPVTYTPTVRKPQKQAASSFESPVTSTPTATFTPVAVLPELYPGVQWKTAKESEELLFHTRTLEVIKQKGYYYESGVVKAYPNDFLDYYHRELAARGWSVTSTADGPNGEWHEYEKDGHYIMFGVRLVSADEFQAVVMHN